MITHTGRTFSADISIEGRAEQEQLAYALAVANHIKILQLNCTGGLPLNFGPISITLSATSIDEFGDDVNITVSVQDAPSEEDTKTSTSISGAYGSALTLPELDKLLTGALAASIPVIRT